LCLSHRIDAELNFRCLDAHNFEHLDPEALVAAFVQKLQPVGYTLDFDGREVHGSGCLFSAPGLGSYAF